VVVLPAVHGAHAAHDGACWDPKPIAVINYQYCATRCFLNETRTRALLCARLWTLADAHCHCSQVPTTGLVANTAACSSMLHVLFKHGLDCVRVLIALPPPTTDGAEVVARAHEQSYTLQPLGYLDTCTLWHYARCPRSNGKDHTRAPAI
jgi:hypothetical protein